MLELSDRPPVAPRPSAAVVLVRPRSDAGVEVFLVRRHRGASFMSSAFVFPGGVAEAGEGDARVTAARELFEEAGVLLTTSAVDAATLARWRDAVLAGASLATTIAGAGVTLALDNLRPLAHWITPSVEPRRYSAHFFVAELPPGQTPSFDDRETVDQEWVTPGEALARAAELRLPPPQVRVFSDLEPACAAGIGALWSEVERRGRAIHPILPRLAAHGDGFALLLPWDPDYQRGAGETIAWPADHPLAVGPSRFVLHDGAWLNVDGPRP